MSVLILIIGTKLFNKLGISRDQNIRQDYWSKRQSYSTFII